MSVLTIRGYTDRPSAAPGERLRVHVSSDQPGEYRAELVRLINGDLNPAAPGPREDVVPHQANGTYSARTQRTQVGGYVEVPDLRGGLAGTGGLSVHAFVSAMAPGRGRQGIVSRWDASREAGWALVVDDDGALAFLVGDGRGATGVVRSDRPLFPDTFYSVTAVYDAGAATLTLYQQAVVNSTNSRFGRVFPLDSDTVVTAGTPVAPTAAEVPVLVAGLAEAAGTDRTWVVGCFNGKIDSPSVRATIVPR